MNVRQIRFYIMAIGAAAVLASTCSDNSLPTGTLSVDYLCPSFNEADVDHETDIKVVFNRDIQAGTLTAMEGFNLQKLPDGATLAVDIQLDGYMATITPVAKLAENTSYRYIIGPDVSDLAGISLGYPVSCRFTTEKWAWDDTKFVETRTEYADSPDISMNAQGHAMAVWHQSNGIKTSIYSKQFVPGVGWGTAELVENNDVQAAMYPNVAMDDSGNAVVVWTQNDSGHDDIWSNRYVTGSGWQTSMLMENDNTDSAYSPRVAMDELGNAMIVWSQGDGTRYNVWARRYAAGSGWEPAEIIETTDYNAQIVELAMDAQGNAIAIWMQYDGTRFNIYTNRYVFGTGWGMPEIRETLNQPAYGPAVAMDAQGNAMAMWHQWDGSYYSIFASYFAVGSGWSVAEMVETIDTGTANYPDLAFDAKGNVIAAWTCFDGSVKNIWANRYIPGTGWGTAEMIDVPTADMDSSSPRVSAGGDGRAVVVWNKNDGMFLSDMWANVYSADSGWRTAGLIETEDGMASSQCAKADSQGNAIVMWSQDTGAISDVLARRFRRQ